ncbi:MAG: NAD(P)H-binding protein, partial [Sciscionella sp.]
PAALDGVSAVYLFPVPDTVPDFLAAATRSGARRVVALSSIATQGEASGWRNVIGERHAVVERAVERSGLEWTFLRPGAFAGNTLQWAPQIRGGGVVRAAYGDAATAPIHERDIAAVAVRALLDEGHAGAAYPLTGPESITQRDQVQLIGEAIGENLVFTELSREAAREAMIDNGAQAPIADTLLDLFASLVGRPAEVVDTVVQVTGTPARSFARWAAEHADAFR